MVWTPRAAQASDRIAGKGYSVLTEASLKTLPELPPGAVSAKVVANVHRRYAKMRDR